jgi:hypothetical protein
MVLVARARKSPVVRRARSLAALFHLQIDAEPLSGPATAAQDSIYGRVALSIGFAKITASG